MHPVCFIMRILDHSRLGSYVRRNFTFPGPSVTACAPCSNIKELSILLFFLFWGVSPLVGQGLLIHEVTTSHTQRRATFGTIPLDD